MLNLVNQVIHSASKMTKILRMKCRLWDCTLEHWVWEFSSIWKWIPLFPFSVGSNPGFVDSKVRFSGLRSIWSSIFSVFWSGFDHIQHYSTFLWKSTCFYSELLGLAKEALRGKYRPFLKLWPRKDSAIMLKVCQVWSLFITFGFDPTLVIPPRSPCVKDYASSTFLALPSTINLNGQIGQWTTPNASCCCGFALVRMPSWVHTYTSTY